MQEFQRLLPEFKQLNTQVWGVSVDMVPTQRAFAEHCGVNFKMVSGFPSHDGAKALGAFDGFLPDLYRQAGFRVVARTKFVDEFAPAGWDYNRFGRPDVVFMSYQGGARDTIRQRFGQFPDEWAKGGTSVDDFDLGQQLARESVLDAGAAGGLGAAARQEPRTGLGVAEQGAARRAVGVPSEPVESTALVPAGERGLVPAGGSGTGAPRPAPGGAGSAPPPKLPPSGRGIPGGLPEDGPPQISIDDIIGKPSRREFFERLIKKMPQWWYDRNHPLKKLQKHSGIPVHQLAQLVPGATAAGEDVVRRLYRPVLRRLRHKDLRDLELYMVFRRMEDILENARRAGGDVPSLPGGVRGAAGVLEEKIKLRNRIGTQKYGQIESVARDLWRLHDEEVLKPLVKEGILSPEAYAAMRESHPHYIPFQRADLTGNVSNVLNKRGEANLSSTGIRRMTLTGERFWLTSRRLLGMRPSQTAPRRRIPNQRPPHLERPWRPQSDRPRRLPREPPDGPRVASRRW